ncbi:hypothetical protein SAMN06265348_11568 [Pedobacter westerhofensis]|uniref:CHRD domain-containing protein n=1 Tax=Pedobacter westerhofensis TaxID=425512 RepID=A0A521FQX6_9SPHI|nr:hypothetical protein [Pedobacter westerhofensis]SMO97940.1 hypothetical protein SAMN06265348_11568 [Pedobacter westerhofensis]
MGLRKSKCYVFVLIIAACCSVISCKKEQQAAEEAKIEAPVRTYVITARIDKKGTNSASEGTGVLKGSYDEQSKILAYTIECENILPALITLRSGVKGSVGELIREMYKTNGTNVLKLPLSGSLTLSPLQERNLLKGLWFIAICTNVNAVPEISGSLTLKQK